MKIKIKMKYELVLQMKKYITLIGLKGYSLRKQMAIENNPPK